MVPGVGVIVGDAKIWTVSEGLTSTEATAALTVSPATVALRAPDEVAIGDALATTSRSDNESSNIANVVLTMSAEGRDWIYSAGSLYNTHFPVKREVCGWAEDLLLMAHV